MIWRRVIMKISEIIELTKELPLAEIAKDRLAIGEKQARQAMKRAGCYTVVGQAGWIFDDTENPENLNRSIYDFAKIVQEERKEELKTVRYEPSIKVENGVPRKRHSFDLDVRVVRDLKLYCVREDKKLYEVVELAIKDYVKKNEISRDEQ